MGLSNRLAVPKEVGNPSERKPKPITVRAPASQAGLRAQKTNHTFARYSCITAKKINFFSFM